MKKVHLKAGKKILNAEHAMAIAGIDEEWSIDKISVDDSTISILDPDNVLRAKRSGQYNGNFLKKMAVAAQEKYAREAKLCEARLGGAKTFSEYLKIGMPENRAADIENFDDIEKRSENGKDSFVAAKSFKTPLRKKNIMVSTPKDGVTNCSFKSLNLSRVININDLSIDKPYVHDVNVNVSLSNEEDAVWKRNPSTSSDVNPKSAISSDKTTSQLDGTFVINAKDLPNNSKSVRNDNSSQPKGTFVIDGKDQPTSANNSKTFTVNNDNSSQAKGTFVIDGNDQPTSSNNSKTFTVNNDNSSQTKETFVIESNDQQILSCGSKTYTVDAENSSTKGTFTVNKSPITQSESQSNNKTTQNSLNASSVDNYDSNKTSSSVAQDGLRDATVDEFSKDNRRSGKIKLSEREQIDQSQYLINSLLGEVSSPGRKLFQNRPKKFRRSKSQIRSERSANNTKALNDITERSIEMLSVVCDEPSIGSSYVEPVSVNQTVISKLKETKSSNNVTDFDCESRNCATENFSADCTTPTKRYMMPTISSLNKSVRVAPEEILDIVSTSKRKANETDIATQSENVIGGLEEAVQSLNVDEDTAEKSTEPATQAESSSRNESSEADGSSSDDNSDDVENSVLNKSGSESSASLENECVEGSSSHRPTDNEDSPNLEVNRQRKRNLQKKQYDNSVFSVNTPNRSRVTRNRTKIRAPIESRNANPMDDTEVDNYNPSAYESSPDVVVLKKRKIIKPETPPTGLRRSKRNRCKPVRRWLGEKLIYQHSPSGGVRMVGVTDVEFTEKKYIKYRTADVNLMLERKMEERKRKKQRAEMRRARLELDHSRGINLNISQEDIVTSDDDE